MFSQPPNGPNGLPRSRTRRAGAGFTLLEVVIAISLTAAVLLILIVGIRVGANALEAGDRQLGRLDRSLAIIQVVEEQVAAAVPRSITTTEDNQPARYLCFRGDSLSARFLTSRSLVSNRNYGLWLATYQVVETADGRQQLEVSEEPALDMLRLKEALLANGLAPGPAESLGDPAQRILLSYLRPPAGDKPSDWVPEWTTKEEQLPLGIRVQVWRASYAGELTFAIPVQKVVAP